VPKLGTFVRQGAKANVVEKSWYKNIGPKAFISQLYLARCPCAQSHGVRYLRSAKNCLGTLF
jgi:hypothetical protein